MKKYFLIILFLVAGTSFAQTPRQPRLVVGIVVDQMRYDYIYRFWNRYGDGGFRKLYRDGYLCRNTSYSYVPTYTGPGHASIYTGTTPSIHGIIANNWYDKSQNKMVYCTEDKAVQPVEGPVKEGQMSPKNMLVTTFGDELKLATNKRAKVIGVSIKDRGAILPAGYLADYALWYSNDGKWMSSSFYADKLPSWVSAYNQKDFSAKFLEKPWQPILPLNQYAGYSSDDNPWEGRFAGEVKSSFPHDLKEGYKKSKYDVLRFTPFGNTMVKDISLEILKNENLGKDDVTDVLAISFSSTDYVGHRFGPSSVELEDTYIRLDRDLEELINGLEASVGKENLLLFLTADHAAPEIPEYLASMKIPAASANKDLMSAKLKSAFKNAFGDTLITSFYNQQLFFDHAAIKSKNINYEHVTKMAVEFLQSQPGVVDVYTRDDIRRGDYKGFAMDRISEGYHLKRSGDIVYNYQPLWMENEYPGTTHGSPYSYDSHVPLFFYGFNVERGSTVAPVDIIDITPTICQFMNISYPSGCQGQPIQELFVK